MTFDLSDPTNPVERGSLSTDQIQPSYGYWYGGWEDCWDCGYYYWHYGSLAAQVAGSTLVFPSRQWDRELLGTEHVCYSYPEYYGSDLGTADDPTAGVRFAWTFTTQSVRIDIEKLIEGLEEGTGPFARLHDAFPPELYVSKLHECNPFGGCAAGHTLPQNVYMIKSEDLAPILLDVAVEVIAACAAAKRAIWTLNGEQLT